MLRWGLLGTARINRLLIPAIRASRRSRVAAIASRDPARAGAYAAEWNIPAARTYDALISDPEIDLVYVPLPNSLHAAWSVRALEAGKHVLCEKPLGLSVEDVDRIALAAARHGRAATEGFMYRHTAQTARILALVGGNAIWTPRAITAAFTFQHDRPADIRLDPGLGGGSLWDVGCYPVSLAQLVAGAAPRRVWGRERRGPTGVDEHFHGGIEYGNGVIAHIECGFRAPYRTLLRVEGDAGILTVDRPFRPSPLERLRLERGGAIDEIAVHGAAIFADEVADMEDAALGLRAPRITLDESRQNVETLTRLYAAARGGDPALA